MPSRLLLLLLSLLLPLHAQEQHDHPAPEKLGTVAFPITCSASVQQPFNRAVALLHSFAYTEARTSFQNIARLDPTCAMAHWGIAMSYYHPLWETVSPAVLPSAQAEIAQALQLKTNSQREQDFIHALSLIYNNAQTVPYRTRAVAYEQAMNHLALANPSDAESQIFYALALLGTALPTDKTHANQKKAVAILEPLNRAYPDHPGITHYLIHGCDNAEMASQGLAAARAYAQIAPSAPHALHMPSHIFTRLGLWQDSISSNLAARDAAHHQGDTGEELHAMDYLVYAYLQNGQDREAAQVIQDLHDSPTLNTTDFKIAYAATAMPIRYAVERGHWTEAADIQPPTSAPPNVIATAVWARGLGLARTNHPTEAREQTAHLHQLEAQLRASGDIYWSTQVAILSREVEAWSLQAEGKTDRAVALLRSAADDEDAVEKLPVTPGPILPAREQLGDLLLAQNQPALALTAFQISLQNAPGRRNSTLGAAHATQLSARK
ncbi:MAG TPA: hypothetical protein VGG95_09870 [Edaphobacter sp.]